MEPRDLERELRENWLSRSQAARLADVSIEAIRLWHSNEKIRAIDTPAGRLYSRADVERVVAERSARD